jgi:succinate dehydrogenase / fumarate reductase iron-sulfur subunit
MLVRRSGSLMPSDEGPITESSALLRASASAERLHMHLWRGDQTGGQFVAYEIAPQDGEVVLDVVQRVQATQAPDLGVRWNCKAGKCGSCAAEVNGHPVLMCMTRISSLRADRPMTVSPMRAFPAVRDLVSDVSYNYEVAKLIPAFHPRAHDPDGLYRMASVDIARGQEFHKCIECFLCQDVCHVIRDHEENKAHYAGPRFFVRLAELEMHPLDTLDRRDYISRVMGIAYCNVTKCCTEVCPEEIHITDNAIIPLKERVVDARYDPIAWLGRKIARRPRPLRAADAHKHTGAAHAQNEAFATSDATSKPGDDDA